MSNSVCAQYGLIFYRYISPLEKAGHYQFGNRIVNRKSSMSRTGGRFGAIEKLHIGTTNNRHYTMAKKSTPIPGLTFSWKRALGITQAKQKISRKTGIPMTKQGIERKIGGAIIRKLFGK